MKKLILPILLCSLLGCTQSGTINQAAIDTGIRLGVTAGLKAAVKDDAKRTIIADYIDVGAQALYSVTGTPTTEELGELITKWIPDNIKKEYPDVVAFIVPVITTAYQAGLDKYGKDTAKVRELLNRMAADLQAGAAPFITKK